MSEVKQVKHEIVRHLVLCQQCLNFHQLLTCLCLNDVQLHFHLSEDRFVLDYLLCFFPKFILVHSNSVMLLFHLGGKVLKSNLVYSYCGCKLLFLCLKLPIVRGGTGRLLFLSDDGLVKVVLLRFKEMRRNIFNFLVNITLARIYAL